MALLVKNSPNPRQATATGSGLAFLSQYIHTACPSKSLPATSTDQIFRVFNGRVLVHLLVGEVTTAIQAQATNVKVTSKKLDSSATAVGTAVDLCANVDGNAKEVGSLYVLLGSGAAAIWSNAGAGIATLGRNAFIVPQGEVYITTGATSTGAIKWDIFWQPLDEGAVVIPVTTATAAI